MKKIEDYLHLYLGCEIRMLHKATNEWSSPKKLTSNVLNQILMHDGGVNFSYQLLLRPLSSMTEEEEEYIQYEIYGSVSDHFANAIKKHVKYVVDWRISSEVVMFLLKQHFDIFDLIDAGLAIDATNI